MNAGRIPRSQRYHRGSTPPAPARRASRPLRTLLLITSPLWIWLAVCLLAVGGWAIPLVYLFAGPFIRRPRGRGRATRVRRPARGGRRV